MFIALRITRNGEFHYYFFNNNPLTRAEHAKQLTEYSPTIVENIYTNYLPCFQSPMPLTNSPLSSSRNETTVLPLEQFPLPRLTTGATIKHIQSRKIIRTRHPREGHCQSITDNPSSPSKNFKLEVETPTPNPRSSALMAAELGRQIFPGPKLLPFAVGVSLGNGQQALSSLC